MSRTSLFLALTLAAALPPLSAQAASTVCRTVNNRTVCSQSGDALTCQTVNGRTQCLSGPGHLRCETVDGRTTCTSTPGPTSGAEMDDPDSLPDADLQTPGLQAPGLRIPSQPPSGVAVERDGHGLRVRTGTLDLRLDGFP